MFREFAFEHNGRSFRLEQQTPTSDVFLIGDAFDRTGRLRPGLIGALWEAVRDHFAADYEQFEPEYGLARGTEPGRLRFKFAPRRAHAEASSAFRAFCELDPQIQQAWQEGTEAGRKLQLARNLGLDLNKLPGGRDRFFNQPVADAASAAVQRARELFAVFEHPYRRYLEETPGWVSGVEFAIDRAAAFSPDWTYRTMEYRPGDLEWLQERLQEISEHVEKVIWKKLER